MHNRQSNNQVFFPLEFVNKLLQMEAKPVKNVSLLLQFSGHSELETGLLVKRGLGSFYVSGKLPTYPSPKPTLILSSHLGQNIGLGEG